MKSYNSMLVQNNTFRPLNPCLCHFSLFVVLLSLFSSFAFIFKFLDFFWNLIVPHQCLQFQNLLQFVIIVTTKLLHSKLLQNSLLSSVIDRFFIHTLNNTVVMRRTVIFSRWKFKSLPGNDRTTQMRVKKNEFSVTDSILRIVSIQILECHWDRFVVLPDAFNIWITLNSLLFDYFYCYFVTLGGNSEEIYKLTKLLNEKLKQ